MKITSEIFQVGGEELTSSQDAAIYLIVSDGQSVLVDAGCGFDQKQLIKNIQQYQPNPHKINLLLLTHCHFDHSGGADQLRNYLGCKIVAHSLDAFYLEEGNNTVTAASWYNATLQPFMIDRKLKKPEETVKLGTLGIKALHVPGHSPGSVVYLMESDEKRVLFGQDLHGPLHPVLKSNREDYNRSLKILLDLDVDILCEGHFGIFDGKKQVRDFITSYLQY